MTVVTLTDFTPVERFDGAPWVTAKISESTASAGPWSLLETITLDPVDTDPTNPGTRDFTFDTATLENGWYQVEWLDEDLNRSVAPPVQNLQTTRAYRPLVGDVGELIRARTRNENGNLLGTFTATTTPTYEQVDRVIDTAMRKLEAKFGPDMAAELVGSASHVVALRAAMLVELSYFGDQIRTDRSPYAALEVLYKEALADWQLERKQLGIDGIPDTADDTSAAGLPAYSFPVIGSECDWGEVTW